MRWTRDSYFGRYRKWQRWFAWHPVRISVNPDTDLLVWLEWVERLPSAGYGGDVIYTYRTRSQGQV